MVKLFSFTICDSINTMQVSVGTVSMIVAPQIALRPQFVPGNYSFGLAIGISGLELKMTNRVKIVITSPEGSVVHDSGEIDLPIVSDDDTLPHEYQGFMMCADIRNMGVPCEGEYCFAFYLNGTFVADKSVPIYRRAAE